MNKEPPPPYSPPYPEVHQPQPGLYYPPPLQQAYSQPVYGAVPLNYGAAPPTYGVAPPNYGATTTTIVVENRVVDACPVCGVGVLNMDYTCLGLLLAIFFFPLGFLCCYLLMVKRCSNCGVTLD